MAGYGWLVGFIFGVALHSRSSTRSTCDKSDLFCPDDVGKVCVSNSCFFHLFPNTLRNCQHSFLAFFHSRRISTFSSSKSSWRLGSDGVDQEKSVSIHSRHGKCRHLQHEFVSSNGKCYACAMLHSGVWWSTVPLSPGFEHLGWEHWRFAAHYGYCWVNAFEELIVKTFKTRWVKNHPRIPRTLSES